MHTTPIAIADAIERAETLEVTERTYALKLTNFQIIKHWLEPIPKGLWGKVSLGQIRLNNGLVVSGRLKLEGLPLETHGERLYHSGLKWSMPIQSISDFDLQAFARANRQQNVMNLINTTILMSLGVWALLAGRQGAGNLHFSLQFFGIIWLVSTAYTALKLFVLPRNPTLFHFTPWTEPNSEITAIFELATRAPGVSIHTIPQKRTYHEYN